MKKLILLGLLISSPVYADIKHSITSSVKLEAVAAGLLSAVMSNMGLQVKNSSNGKKRLNNVTSSKDPSTK